MRGNPTQAAVEIIPLREHLRIVRECDQALQEERDRRYAEVAIARAEALRIKEVADRDALELARQIQTYKDEKANELREQISSERGLYASKDDLENVAEKLEATIAPLTAWVQAQTGRSQGLSEGAKILIASLGGLATVSTIIGFVLAFRK
jgi:hypothetical protein